MGSEWKELLCVAFEYYALVQISDVRFLSKQKNKTQVLPAVN